MAVKLPSLSLPLADGCLSRPLSPDKTEAFVARRLSGRGCLLPAPGAGRSALRSSPHVHGEPCCCGPVPVPQSCREKTPFPTAAPSSSLPREPPKLVSNVWGSSQRAPLYGQHAADE